MVLVSERRECSPNNRPPMPMAVRYAEPDLFWVATTWPEVRGARLVKRRAARIPSTRPVPFHPPFSACMMGQMGLLVHHANLTVAESISPTVQARILDSRRASLAESA